MQVLMLGSIGLPVTSGVVLLAFSLSQRLKAAGRVERTEEEGKLQEGGAWLYAYVFIALICSVGFSMAAAWWGNGSVTVFQLLDTISIYFHVDETGRLFMTIISIIWLIVGIYSVPYMRREGGEKRYYAFFLLAYGMLTGFVYAGNLITMYLFYELITLVSMPLVLHNGTREAVRAGRKYLFYSLCGAYCGLFGIFFLYRYCGSMNFTPGGTLEYAMVSGHEDIVLLAVFVMLLGFGVKAGMLPLHAWLPTAHPVAPSPASAALSSVIVKAGVIAIIRVIFYVVGREFLQGTWVQYTWMTLALLTVFMGSMLAYREQGFKKRLAYSTVSQVSYILFGLSLMTSDALSGALLHVIAHGFIKCGLFLTAGVFLHYYGYGRVEQLRGIGKKMPLVLGCFTLFSLGLIGIPPTLGFLSKWYLAQGALQSQIPVFSWLGPMILLISAFLTAGYLLPVTINGFFPGEETSDLEHTGQKDKTAWGMGISLLLLAVFTLLPGIFPKPLLQFVSEAATIILK